MDLAEAGLRLVGMEPRGDKTSVLRASFSTNTLPTLLGDSANKLGVAAYRAIPSIAKQVSKKLSAVDFKEHVGIRLTGSSNMLAQLGNAAEIAHGDLQEAVHTYRVETYARMFGITRQDLINDDLSKFGEIPTLIATGYAQKLESVFWTLVLANAGSFFSDGNGNSLVLELGEAGLAAAVALMRKQTNEEGEPITSTPKFLVVPPELETVADGLYAAKNIIIAGDTDASRTDANIFAGKYLPLVCPHLSNENYTGNSTTQWYLFSDPAGVAAYGLAFLNGVDAPTIETADADFNTLGLQVRGYGDFGVCTIDSKGAVKSTGVGE
jgi:hypothetical protein